MIIAVFPGWLPELENDRLHVILHLGIFLITIMGAGAILGMAVRRVNGTGEDGVTGLAIWLKNPAKPSPRATWRLGVASCSCAMPE